MYRDMMFTYRYVYGSHGPIVDSRSKKRVRDLAPRSVCPPHPSRGKERYCESIIYTTNIMFTEI